MYTTKYNFFTIKNTSNNHESISYKLMIRTGMIRKINSGIYIWLPLGTRVLEKVKKIIRNEMKKADAIEIIMPFLQPYSLWKKSNRLNDYREELFHIIDRKKRHFILGPTHEEIITFLIKNEIHSYKQLPINLFQIQTKFRDEMRSRFGVIRSREFLMKDSYSFHLSKNSLKNTYKKMHNIYKKIFHKMKINFNIVEADNGSIGGNVSHEFQAISKSGEDKILSTINSKFSTKIIKLNLINIIDNRFNKYQKIFKIITKISNIKKLAKNLMLSKSKIIKLFLVKEKLWNGENYILVLIKYQNIINIKNIENTNFIKIPVNFIKIKNVLSIFKKYDKSLGIMNFLKYPLIIDIDILNMNNVLMISDIKNEYFYCENIKNFFINPKNVISFNKKEKNIINNKKNKLLIKNCIEIGHIFQIGDKYSKLINATVQNKIGKNNFLYMGCYGIGITRLIATIIEQHHDAKGIKWPVKIAPFEIAIIPINMYNDTAVKKTAINLYNIMSDMKIDVLLDNRNITPGTMFKDIELIGIPHIMVINSNNLLKKKIEYQSRYDNKKFLVSINKISSFILKKLKN